MWYIFSQHGDDRKCCILLSEALRGIAVDGIALRNLSVLIVLPVLVARTAKPHSGNRMGNPKNCCHNVAHKAGPLESFVVVVGAVYHAAAARPVRFFAYSAVVALALVVAFIWRQEAASFIDVVIKVLKIPRAAIVTIVRIDDLVQTVGQREQFKYRCKIGLGLKATRLVIVIEMIAVYVAKTKPGALLHGSRTNVVVTWDVLGSIVSCPIFDRASAVPAITFSCMTSSDCTS